MKKILLLLRSALILSVVLEYLTIESQRLRLIIVVQRLLRLVALAVVVHEAGHAGSVRVVVQTVGRQQI